MRKVIDLNAIELRKANTGVIHLSLAGYGIQSIDHLHF